MSIEDDHNIIDSYMKENNKTSDEIPTIKITLKSPYVPTMTLVDTSGLLLNCPTGPASVDAIKQLLKASNEPISCLFCITAPRRGSGYQAEVLAFKQIRDMFLAAHLPFSQKNAMVVMSKIDQVRDGCYMY